MSAVRQAIAILSRAVDNLESSVGHVEQALTGKQRDMFAMPARAPEGVANSNDLDAELWRANSTARSSGSSRP